jgi:hypothetical protein
MKKIFAMLALFFFFLVGAPSTATATAQTGAQYACVLSDDVYFYTTENEYSGIFTLPKTYYVKILSVGERFTRVEYLTDTEYTKTLVGYCLTYQLTFVDYTPLNPYLYTTFDVIYTAANGDGNDEILEKLVFTCGYYGEYSIGAKRYAYVYQNGSCAYVPRPEDFRYAENPEYADRLSSPAESPSEEGINPIQLGVLAVLCLLVPLLAAIILKTNKAPVYDPEE